MPKKSKDSGHEALNDAFVALGRQLAKKVDAGRSLKLSYKVPVKKFEWLIAKQKAQSGWPSFYRNLSPAMDELVSTSTMRDLIKGFAAEGGLSPAQESMLLASLHEISEIRIPTKYVGYAFRNKTLGIADVQHPTKPNGGFWMPERKTGDHNALDVQRRRAVYDVMKEEKDKTGSTAQSVLEAGTLRSLTFTVNEFMGPATADNLQTMSSVSLAEKNEQVAYRERLKNEAVRMGASRLSGTNTSRSRSWNRTVGQREISPERTT